MAAAAGARTRLGSLAISCLLLGACSTSAQLKQDPYVDHREHLRIQEQKIAERLSTRNPAYRDVLSKIPPKRHSG